jgi:hypothetical protein
MKTFILLAGLLVLVVACKKDKEPTSFDQVTITLIASGPAYEGDFYQGYLPNTDFAIWIEDENHNYIKTLLLDTTIVQVGEHGAHSEHLPEWQRITGLSNDSLALLPLDDKNIPVEFDGITGASMHLNSPDIVDTIQVVWDLTDAKNEVLEKGVYYFCAEVANIEKYTDNPAEVLINNEFTRGSIDLNKYSNEEAVGTLNIIELSAK